MTTELLIRPATIPVAFARRPFGGDIYRGVAVPGQTLAAIVADVPGLPRRFAQEGVVCVNGEPVPRRLWGHVRPRGRPDGTVGVTLHLAPRKGDTVRLIATVAVLFAAAAVSGGALGPALAGTLIGSFTIAQAAGAAIAIGGSLAIAALIPPPRQADAPSTAGQQPSVAGISGNVLAPGAPVPRVIGTCRVAPPFLCDPLVETVGDDQYAEAVFGLAGPHLLSDIRFGKTVAADIADVTVQTREGWSTDAALTLVTRQSKTDSPNQQLSLHQVKETPSGSQLANQATPASSLPVWHQFVTRDSPDELWLSLACPEGLYEINTTNPLAIPFRLRVRLKGAAPWINLPEVHLASTKANTLRKEIRLLWRASPGTPATAGGKESAGSDGFWLAHKNVPAQAITPAMGGWVANSYFSGGTPDYYVQTNSGTTGVRNVLLYQDRVEFYLNPATFPKGVYEVQIIAGFAIRRNDLNVTNYFMNSFAVFDLFGYSDSAGIHQVNYDENLFRRKVAVQTVTNIWNSNPVPNQDFALIAVRAKARQLETLTVLASGYVQDWNGSAWANWTTSSNPAPHLRDVLVGALNHDPVPADLVDDTDMLAFRTYCASKSYQCNAVVTGRSARDVADMIAACGYGRPRQCEKFGVMIDQNVAAQGPVQTFSPRNLANFRWEKAFPRRPDGIRAKFSDSTLDYIDNEVIVLDPLATTGGTQLDEHAYPGLVTTAEITAHALYDLGVIRRRMTFYNGTADLEHIVCRRGDLVAVQHDILTHQAGFARLLSKTVVGGNITALTLDGTVPVPGGSMGVAIRLFDGAGTLVKQVTATGTDATQLTISTPFADLATLKAGCWIATGPLGSEYKRLLVFDIMPQRGQTADLTFVDEAPELFA